MTTRRVCGALTHVPARRREGGSVGKLSEWRTVAAFLLFAAAAITSSARTLAGFDGTGGGVTLSPNSLSFGNQVLNEPSTAQIVTLANGSAAALTITSIILSLSDYTQTNTCPISPAELAAGVSCSISVTFTPSALGLRQATLTISDTGSSGPHNVPLNGTGIAAVTVSHTSISFGNQVIGQKSQKNITVTNNQTSSLTITSIATDLSDFSTGTNCPLSPNALAAGASCWISVFFTPSAAGAETGTLTVMTNSGTNPTVALSGTGVAAAPPPPTGVVSSPGNGQVVLSWSPSLGATSYTVSRSTISGGPYTQVGNTTSFSFTDTGLANNTTYYYVITASNAGGTSGNSSEVSATPEFVPGFGNIQHIVYIVKENRSFDNYFGTYPGADGATTATLSTGQVIPLGHASDRVARDLGHQFYDSWLATDYGKMDKFDLVLECNVNGDYLCLSQLTQSDIPNYWSYANNFVLADHMFSSLSGPSFPNHLYTVASTSGGVVSNPHTLSLSWGCDAPSGTLVDVIDTEGNESSVVPCFDFQTLADGLQNAGLAWRYYSPAQNLDGYQWNALDAINHIRNTSLWNNVALSTQFVSDALTGQLPAVSWLVTSSDTSEHPAHSSCAGENWTVEQINAIMQGPLWQSTAVFVTWDDFGGFYDHEPPPVEDEYGLGIRVPLLIISPYVEAGYISHTRYEPSSFLKFAEERFGLSPLGGRDVDANDTLDSFNLTQPPLAPLILSTRTCPVASTPNVSFFSEQAVGTSSAVQKVQITNYGTNPMTVQSVTTTGDFSNTQNCPPYNGMAQYGSCQISVTFTPTATGQRAGTLTVVDTDPSSPQVVTLVGTGTYVSFSASTVSFGATLVHTPATPQTVTLTNTAAVPLSITSLGISGDFAQTNTCGSLVPAMSSCTITVTFTPTTTGSRYGLITINDSDGGSPNTVPLTGIGTEVSLSATKLFLGNTSVGAIGSSKSVTLTNKGNSGLTITAITLSGTPQTPGYGAEFSYPGMPTVNFTETNDCGTSLVAGASCTITVTFTPTVSGSINGAVTVFDSESDSPQSFAVSGSAN